jgi:hypothetical protein
VFTPLELIEKLIPLIPRPRAHMVRYHGILGPAAKEREQVVRNSGPVEFGRAAATEKGPREIDPIFMPRFGRLPWAVLLKRVFLVDVLECPKCSGRMQILAAVTALAGVRRILNHLGLPCEAPHLQAARPRASPLPLLERADREAQPDGFYPDPPSPES